MSFLNLSFKSITSDEDSFSLPPASSPSPLGRSKTNPKSRRLALPKSHTDGPKSRKRHSVADTVSAEPTPIVASKQKNDGKLTAFEKIKLETNRNTSHGHPLILPSPYGDCGPVFDVIALFQNAVKKEVLVAYDLVEAMTRNKYEVTHVELNLFLNWFDTFEEVLRVIFDVEESCVYPFLNEAGVGLPPELSPDTRKVATDGIKATIERITDKREMFQYLPAGETVPRLTKLLIDFLNLTVQYYNMQSSTLPRLILEADFDGDSDVVLRTKFMIALRSRPNFATTIPFVTHWLPDKKLRRWKANYLSGMDGLRYEQWVRKYDSNHHNIPEKIRANLAKAREGKSPDTVKVPTSPRFGKKLWGKDDDGPRTPRTPRTPVTPRFGRRKHASKI